MDKLFVCPWRGMKSPDPWQQDALQQLITMRHNVIMLCSRQSGKSETVGLGAYLEAAVAGGYALIISRSDRQALKVFDRVLKYHRQLGLVDAERETMHELVLSNGGKIAALPCKEDTIRGEAAVTLLIIDEAAVVPDNVWGAVTPMISSVNGRIALLSTPKGKRGFFYKEYSGGGREGWRKHTYTWRGCPRTSEKHIAAERRSHDELWIRQEYECEFLDVSGMGFFDVSSFERLIAEDNEVLLSW